jgi:hypothetical protein
MWFLLTCVILTKDSLLRRHGEEDYFYCFCDNNETIQHLLFDCHVTSFI